jgi:acyl dehydratase
MMKLEIGQELAPKTFIINRKLLIAYASASGDQNPIHQDETFAKSVGLPDVIAHGMLTMALAGKYLSEISGSQNIIDFSAKFIKPVVVPADVDVALIVSGKVTEVVNGTAKIELLAMCNEIKVLGVAKGLVKL